MNTRKTVISSVLANDLGIEDFQNDTVMNRGSENLASYDLSNKLGLLAPLADRADTEVVTFGSEAYSLLGEAKQLEQFAGQQIENINNRFSIAAEIKKGYGVEGFDAFAFGCEGFKETITKAFTAVVAAIKKVIQSITNWIRQVMNWVGSQFAKGQQKLVEKYKNAKFTDTTVMIKAIVPEKKITSGTKLVESFNNTVTDIGQKIVGINKMVSSVISDGSGAVEYNVHNGTDKLGSSTIPVSAGKAEGNKAAANLGASVIKGIYLTTYYGKKVDVVKVGSASKIANDAVFGSEKPQKITVSALKFINEKVDWKTILSKDDLKATQKLVSYGKALIKALNEALKNANKLASSLKLPKDAAGSKANNNAVKKYRSAVSALNGANRIGSLQAGILYGTFANYLKIRSYTAAAVKALAAGTAAKGKKAPKAGSAKDNLNKARQAING